MKTKVIVVIVLILLVVSVAFYFSSGGKSINEDISVNKLSAKELVAVAKPYVDKYWGDRRYYVGKITMTLDRNYEGKVEIWYKDDKKDRNGVPNIITVEIDTKEKKILRIINQERNSKIEPGIINITNWNIDSSDAITMAEEAFNNSADFDFTDAYIFGTSLFRDGKETWDVSLFNHKNKKAYYFKVDAYTGKVYRNEVK